MYPEELVLPMKAELTENGFADLTTPEQVNEALKQSGTTLLVINSVCGCSAGAARPGVLYSLTGEKKPDHLVTSFAGFDKEAVAEARKLMAPFPPSSPCVALFNRNFYGFFCSKRALRKAICSSFSLIRVS